MQAIGQQQHHSRDESLALRFERDATAESQLQPYFHRRQGRLGVLPAAVRTVSSARDLSVSLFPYTISPTWKPDLV